MAGAAAFLGVASFMLLPFVGRAGAQTTVIDAYEASGSARAVQLEIALRPSIFDPLVQVAVPFARTQIASLGQGSGIALASQVFPGDLVVGALTCNPQARPLLTAIGTAQAAYPPDECKPASESARPLRLTAIPPEGEPMVDPGPSHASSKLYEATATATSGRLSLPGVIEIRSLETKSASVRTDKQVVHESRVVAKGIRIADVLLIESIVSTAPITSDGVEATAEPLFQIGRVQAILGGKTYEASIDQKGVHLIVPDAEGVPSLEQSLSQALQYQLGKAGIAKVFVGATQTLTDGPSAETSIGGLQLTLGGAISGVPIPTEVREVFGQIQNDIVPPDLQKPRCPLDDPETEDVTPPCVNPIAVIPLEGSEMAGTISIAGASAKAFGFPSVAGDPLPGDGGVFPPPPGGELPGSGFLPGENVGGGIPNVTAPAPQTGPVKLFGLVARMPSAALVAAGAIFLVFAVGVGFAPSSLKT